MNTYRKLKSLTKENATYIAGLIDGEGTITLTQRHRNENRQLVVSISNNEKDLLKFIQAITCVGSISKKRTYADNHKINFTYKVSNRQALALLEKVFIYLRTYKQERAKLVIDHYLNVTPRNGKYTNITLKKREKFVADFFEIVPE